MCTSRKTKFTPHVGTGQFLRWWKFLLTNGSLYDMFDFIMIVWWKLKSDGRNGTYKLNWPRKHHYLPIYTHEIPDTHIWKKAYFSSLSFLIIHAPSARRKLLKQLWHTLYSDCLFPCQCLLIFSSILVAWNEGEELVASRYMCHQCS